MKNRFYWLLIPVALLSGISTILKLLFISDYPHDPPSITQLELRNKNTNKKNNFKNDLLIFKKSIMNLLKNLNIYFIWYYSWNILFNIY
jgi:hypothetical protein